MKRVFLFLSLSLACATTQTPRTVGKGNIAAGLSVGGIVTHIPGVPGKGNIPLPYPVLEGRYGLKEDLDVHMGTHILMDALGNIQFDLGATKLLLAENGDDHSAVAVTGKVMTFINPGEPLLLLPEGTLTFSNRFGESLFLYGGIDLVLGQEGTSSGAGESPVLVATPFIGTQIPTGQKIKLALEVGWIAPYLNTQDSVVRFPLPGNEDGGNGGLSIKLGVSYQLKGRKAEGVGRK